jgi:peptide/nickel transport system ATP-binding protein
MGEPLLSLRQLKVELQIEGKSYPVVEEMSFDLYSGKTLAIVGESGSGKSLTALSLLGLLPTPPALSPKGEIWYRGENLIQLPEKKIRKIRGQNIAMIFQDPLSSLNPVYSIGEQLLEVTKLHLGLFGEEAYYRAVEALSDVGIPRPHERFYDYPHQLSGGMRQRVMIAMALMCRPEILIADEPTTALDVTIQAQVLDLIRNLQKERGMALLLITHDMGVVAEMADEVILMYAGKKIEQGSSLDIFDHMSHPYTQALFQSRPTLHGHKGERLKNIKGSVPIFTHYPEACRFHPRCPYVMEKCKKIDPPALPGKGYLGHKAYCWLQDGSEESQQRIKEVENGKNHP